MKESKLKQLNGLQNQSNELKDGKTLHNTEGPAVLGALSLGDFEHCSFIQAFKSSKLGCRSLFHWQKRQEKIVQLANPI